MDYLREVNFYQPELAMSENKRADSTNPTMTFQSPSRYKGNSQINGIITSNGSPARRRVIAVNKNDPTDIKEVYSDAVTGAYLIQGTTDADEYHIIAISEAVGNISRVEGPLATLPRDLVAQTLFNEQFTRAVDPNWSSVKSLMLMNQERTGLRDFFDETGRIWTPEGQAAISDGEAKVGQYSYFNGSANSGNGLAYLDADDPDFIIAGDFTFQTWIYQTADTEFSFSAVFTKVNTSNRGVAAQSSFELGISNSSGYYPTFLSYNTDAGAFGGVTSSIPITLNNWHHVAWVRDGNDLVIFVDGVEGVRTAISGTGIVSTAPVAIGASYQNDTTKRHSLQGYLDLVKFTNGVAEYTAPFTPPTTHAFPAEPIDEHWGETRSLLKFEGVDESTTIIDEKYGPVWSVVSDAKIKTDQYRFGNSAAYFDGTSDRIDGTHSTFPMGTGDFTYECWIRPIDPTGAEYQTIIKPQGGVGLYIYDSKINWYESSGRRAESEIIVADEWYHVAASRESGTLRVFVNGIESSTNYSSSFNITSNTIVLGRHESSDVEPFNGWIGFSRVTTYARYVDDFNPPVYIATK